MCNIPDIVKGIYHFCSTPLTSDTQDRIDYNVSWSPQIIQNSSSRMTYNSLEKSFTYQTSEELNGLDYWGYFQWYDGGGYVANLGNTLPDAEKLIAQLQSHKWIDQYTRVVFIEFNVWNANSNMFNLFVLTFEFPSQGSVFNWVSIDSVNLYRYTGPGGLINLLSEVIMSVYIIVITILEIRKVVKTKGKHLKSSWNIVLMFCLACYYLGMGVYAWRSVITVNKVEEMMNNRGTFIIIFCQINNIIYSAIKRCFLVDKYQP